MFSYQYKIDVLLLCQNVKMPKMPIWNIRLTDSNYSIYKMNGNNLFSCQIKASDTLFIQSLKNNWLKNQLAHIVMNLHCVYIFFNSFYLTFFS